MKKHHITILSILLLSITIPSILIFQILEYKKNQLKSINDIMFQEAKSHFDGAVMTRKWNAQYGGVYVKKIDTIEPNKYLKNSHLFSDKGEMLVKINPAWMTRQISEISNTHRDYYFKITSLNPLNPDNLADEFETRGLKTFEENKNKRFFYEVDNETNYFNLIGSLKVEASCLSCHSEQGYKMGDIRGGIRVSVPIHSHNAKINEIETNTVFSIILVIIIALLINIFMIRSILIILKQNEQYHKLNKNLEKRVKEEIKKNQEKERILSQQSKMAALGEMLNNIAHQWRQPLSTITTATSGMQLEREMGILDDKEFSKNTNIIMEQASYMSKTIDDFKNFFSSDKKKVKFSLKDLITMDIDLVKSSYSSNNIIIQISEVQEYITLYGYKNELSQAILNILNNAKDQFSQSSQEHNVIKISTQLEQNKVKIFIHDNAGGVPEEIIDKIFEPYFTTKHQSQGTGIGLYMTQRIIVDHLNGNVKIDNEEMKIKENSYIGACFTITLPILSEID